jgi:hypothetical protein
MQVAGGTLPGTSIRLAATPGRSATLLVLPSPGGTAGDGIFASGFE